MSIFDSVFGVNQSRNDASASYTDSNNILKRGKNRALANTNQGYTQANNTTRQYGTQGRSALTSSYNQSRSDITGGYNDATSAITTGENRALSAVSDAMSRTRSTLNPWIERGTQAADRYNTYLGLNGDDAQRDALQTYYDNDPFREFQEDTTRKAYERGANAGGRVYDVRTETAIARANLERASQDYNSYLDRLFGVSQQGGQYASTLAGYENQAGRDEAGIYQNAASQRSSAAQNRGSQLANASQNYGNAMNSSYTAEGNRISSNQAQAGRDRANINYGFAQQKAGNRINYGNAMAETRGEGLNRAINAAGTLIKARYGMS